MADDKTTKGKPEAPQNKDIRPKKENKFVSFVKRLPRTVATPFKNMWHELRKVTWPTRKDLISYTGIVLVFMVFMGVVIGLLDMGASRLITAISSLVKVEADAPADTTLGDGVTAPDDGATVTDDHDHDGDGVPDHD